MGILATRWEADHQGHKVTVSRNEIGRGFSLEWDGREIARRVWSWFGLGELHGTAELDGNDVEVRCVLELGEGIDGACRLSVDGQPLEVRKIR